MENTGSNPLNGVVVTDDFGTPDNPHDDLSTEDGSIQAVVGCQGVNVGDVNHNRLLDAGERWLYRVQDLVRDEVEYANLGTVVATTVSSGTVVTDSDPSHYTGVVTKTCVCPTGEKPQVLTMRYTATDIIDHAQKAGKVVVCGKLNGATEVRILATDRKSPCDSKAKVYFDGQVNRDGIFAIDAGQAGESRLKSDRVWKLFRGVAGTIWPGDNR